MLFNDRLGNLTLDMQNRYALIKALMARNQAQLRSFGNEYESLDSEKQQLLASKKQVAVTLEFLAEQEW